MRRYLTVGLGLLLGLGAAWVGETGTAPATQPGENLPQAEVATVMEMASRAEIIALGVIEKKRDETARDAGIAYDVRLEKVLKGKWDKRALHFRSAGWVGYARYDEEERVLLFLKRFNNELVQLKPVVYLGDTNRVGGLRLQPEEEYIKVLSSMPAGGGFPWGDALPGSEIPLQKAVQQAAGSGVPCAVVCRAASGFGDESVSHDGIRQKDGKLSAIQAYEVQEVLWGNKERGRTGIVYGVTHTPSVRERPVRKDETVLWICGRHGGIKVLADTPANRQAVKEAVAAATTQPTTTDVQEFAEGPDNAFARANQIGRASCRERV
jgi:hypothetical protein